MRRPGRHRIGSRTPGNCSREHPVTSDNGQGPTLASPRHHGRCERWAFQCLTVGSAAHVVAGQRHGRQRRSRSARAIAPTKAAKSEPVAESNANLLFAHKSPVLSVETKGPRHIAIGKEAAYEVTIQNSGDVVADEVVVFIGLPAWADIAGAEASAAPRGPPPAAAPPNLSNGTSAAWRPNRGRSWCCGWCRVKSPLRSGSPLGL